MTHYEKIQNDKGYVAEYFFRRYISLLVSASRADLDVEETIAATIEEQESFKKAFLEHLDREESAESMSITVIKVQEAIKDVQEQSAESIGKAIFDFLKETGRL